MVKQVMDEQLNFQPYIWNGFFSFEPDEVLQKGIEESTKAGMEILRSKLKMDWNRDSGDANLSEEIVLHDDFETSAIGSAVSSMHATIVYFQSVLQPNLYYTFVALQT